MQSLQASGLLRDDVAITCLAAGKAGPAQRESLWATRHVGTIHLLLYHHDAYLLRRTA